MIIEQSTTHVLVNSLSDIFLMRINLFCRILYCWRVLYHLIEQPNYTEKTIKITSRNNSEKTDTSDLLNSAQQQQNIK